MKKLVLVLAMALVLALAIFVLEAGAVPGCCCDPITFNGTFIEPVDCMALNYTFIGGPPNLTVTCTEFCNATLAPSINITPPPPSVDCSSPSYKPAPSGLSIKAVKGKKHLALSFVIPCPAYSLNISRCKGDSCTNFAPVAQIAPSTVYIDIDASLNWNTTYRYRLAANYVVSGISDPAYIAGNPGDIECWNQGTAQFCVTPFYYELFEQYLKARGYHTTTPAAFVSNFGSAVNSTFVSRLNKGWYCNDVNLLYQNPSSIVSCPASQLCVADENGAQCVVPSACAGGGLFGLYSSVLACEGYLGVNYCFFDRSRGSVDRCFGCSPRMACADYRTSGACQRDNCNAGDCEWRDVFHGIGIGVCVDTRFPNCPWCTRPGTLGLGNNESYNEVFDRCTDQKSGALSVPGHPCTFNKNSQESLGCDAAACMDYTPAGCASPPAGITLNADNSLATASVDACNIKACQVMGSTGCAKNRDGSALPDCPESLPDRRACELDYFPPNTSLVPSANVPGRMDWLAVNMLDKFNLTHDGALMQGQPGYRVKVCVVGSGSPCTDASLFAEANLSRLNFNDLSLQAGKAVLATMAVGANTLRYFSIDRRSNPEIIKEMPIIACDVCQGPKVLEMSVTPGRQVNGVYYTISDIPVITVSFNEPAIMTSALLMSGSTVIPLTATPGSGANYDYSFIPLNALPDGTYTFTFNAKDSNGLLMDWPGSMTVVVDTTPGTVAILPPDGTILNDTSVAISFIFTEPLSLLNATLEHEVWVSKYATRNVVVDLLPLLSSSDNITYTAAVTGLAGGKKNIKVSAEDFAGNPTIGKSSFWVNTGALKMRMREPSWGVSGSFVFDVIIDTTRVADCRYLYNTPVAPPVSQFDFMTAFPSSTGVAHSIPGFSLISPGDLSRHKLHVYCKLGANVTLDTFEMSVDPTPPVIKSAYAQPGVIIEQAIPGQDIFTTWLKVQTDDLGFCKYDAENVPYILMDGKFSDFDEIPKQSHTAEVNVTQDDAGYTYYVACQNIAEKPSPAVPVGFSVDLSVPFGVASKTPPYSNSTSFVLSVESNKRAFCYMGEVPEAVLTCMGACGFGHSHEHPVEVNESGNYTWYVQCSTGTGSEVVTLAVPVIVDTTPPYMLFVNDSSNIVAEPEFSYFLDRLQVKFLGADDITSVNSYYYRVKSFFSNDSLTNWTASSLLNGTAFFIMPLALVDGNKYRIEVYPVNAVGLQGDALASDGVTVDVEKMPAACQNGALDAEEADLDCGGQCPGCQDGASCSQNIDCVSGFCNEGVCAPSACDDLMKNGNETGVDCAGGSCPLCGMNQTCVSDSDCASSSCNYGLCGIPDECGDGVLSGSETDVDCGGSCPAGCGEGGNCQSSADCGPGLLCIDSACQSEQDSDNDGVKDDVDRCPNTPPDEVADAEGCSPSQKFTCGDEISDGWRMRYFDSVLCDGDGAPGADPDRDGLSNSEEYRHNTDPVQADTDFDGWDDRVEVLAGTDPLDPASHPPSKVRVLLWVLLVLLILAALAIGGYVGYQYYLEKYAVPPEKPAPAAARPSRKLRVWPGIFERLRGIARREEPGLVDRDWVSLAALSERMKEEKVELRPSAFARLQRLVQGKVSRRAAPAVLAAIRREPEAFALLRRISFEQLTASEKELVRRQFSLLKAGKLTPAEIEELLSRLRVTAAYYRAHRDELDRELARWLRE